MKNRLLLLVVAFLTVAGCKEYEIAYYEAEPRLEFIEDQYFAFNDYDYIAELETGNKMKEFEVNTRLVGAVLKESMNYCVKVEKDSLGNSRGRFVLKDVYTFPADTMLSVTSFQAERPAIGKGVEMKLVFDGENPDHQFESGRAEHAKCKVHVSFSIRPSAWGAQNHWGTYSNQKYLFMLEHFKKTYADIPRTEENLQWIADEYAKYREAGNPPLMDDEKEPGEIFFPVNND